VKKKGIIPYSQVLILIIRGKKSLFGVFVVFLKIGMG